jgi:N-acetyl-gamma-glutamyl-phosphate reductase
MLNCAIVGATGYTGVELIKILLRHPHARITGLTTRQKDPIPVRQLIPSLPADVDLEIRPYSFADIKKKADVVFLCLPHTEAMETAAKFLAAGKIVIDLSADFRLRDVKTYEQWYGVKHKNRELLKKAVYGLPELYREKIQVANLIANPGCYPTGSILAIAPLLQNRLIDTESIVVDAKSGVSGAGKKLTTATQYCEVDENFYAYKVGRHQHTPEIAQALSDAADDDIWLTFVPHLLPVDRGILSTIYLKRRKGVDGNKIAAAYNKAYGNLPFVRLKAQGTFPSLKDVQRTNFCDIGFLAEADSDRLIVISAIDNLLKGASGQAVQNMNIRAGFAEDEGLRTW